MKITFEHMISVDMLENSRLSEDDIKEIVTNQYTQKISKEIAKSISIEELPERNDSNTKKFHGECYFLTKDNYNKIYEIISVLKNNVNDDYVHNLKDILVEIRGY